MRILSLFIIVFLLGSTSLISQTKTDLPSHLLIPYNDHGKWGWCDTLGNIIIEPQFKWVGFFDKNGRTKVETNFGFNFYKINEGLLIPEELAIEETIKGDIYLVRDSTTTFGVYSITDQKLLVPISILNYYIPQAKSGCDFILFRKTYNGEYKLFNTTSKTIEPTDIISIKNYEEKTDHSGPFGGYGEKKDFFKHTDQTYSTIEKGKLVKTTFDSSKWMIMGKYDEWYGSASSSDDTHLHSGSFRPMKTTDTLKTYKFPLVTLKSTSNANCRNLSIQAIQKNKKIGLIDEQGNSILPVKYDWITIDNKSGEVWIGLKGKVGLLLPCANNSIIEPKYRSLIYSGHKLIISEKNSFKIYKVKINKETVYVGQNGIEYFKLD